MKERTPSLSPTSILRRFCRYRSLLYICRLSILGLGLHSARAAAQDVVVLVGSGSTVPAPLYRRWTLEYGKRKPNIQVRYLPMSTGEGIEQIARGVGDFSAGEAPLTDQEQKHGLIELPVVIIAIVPIYNLPGVQQQVRLSGDVLAEIFLGEVKRWNAPQLMKLNPRIALPNIPIHVINRPAGRGSNYVFTCFLSKVSSKFRAQVGITSSPKWPVGESAERSADMAEKVRNSPGSIGYIESQYAVKGSIPQAAVLNPAGRFVTASAESIAAAGKATEDQRDNLSASLTNAPGADSFPIASFTWIYLRIPPPDSAREAALGDFLNWLFWEGQEFAGQEGYALLSPPTLAAVRKKVKRF